MRSTIPEQFCVLHARDSNKLPLHPPCFGEVQTLVLDCEPPPHNSVQTIHSVHWEY